MVDVTRRSALGYTALALSVCGGASAVLAANTPDVKILAGKSVLVLAPDEPLARDLTAALSAHGANVSLISTADLTDDAWSAALLTGAKKPGKSDVVVNLCMPHGTGAVGEIALPEFRRVLLESYGRAFLGVKYGIMHLRAHGGGALVNVTSADGQLGNPKAAAASATSGGVIIMTKSAALECAAKGDNIRANGLLVGNIVRGKPRKGQVTAEDVAAAVAFISADAASYLTGIVMPVDNGGMPL